MAKNKRCLLIIDVQMDFLPPNGSLAVPDGDSIVPVINRLRSEVEWDAIFLTQDWHPADHVSYYENNKNHQQLPGATLFKEIDIPGVGPQVLWPTHCVQGSDGAKLSPNLLQKQSDTIIKKGMDKMVDMYSGFFPNEKKRNVPSELHEKLSAAGIKELYCVGLAFDFCVGSTALDAASLGYTTYIIEDCTRFVAKPFAEGMKKRLIDAKVSLKKSNDFFVKPIPKLIALPIYNPEGLNFIFGQSHFIKTVEDIYEILVTSGAAIQFGIAFCEASGDCLIRADGNDKDLVSLAKMNANAIGCGHSFIIFLKNAFPINVLNSVKMCSEVCHIFCATANPTKIVIAEEGNGRGVMGVIDGEVPVGFEQEEDRIKRKAFLRDICGYKRGGLKG